MSPGASDPTGKGMKLHVNGGHAAAHQLKRALVDAGGDILGLLGRADVVLQQCDVCRAFDRDPHLPVAGAPLVSFINERLALFG